MNVIINAIKKSKSRDMMMMLYWIPYLLIFKKLEISNKSYHIIESSIDNIIPFISVFVYPYLFWFVYMAICIVYLFIYDKKVYRHLMIFIILGYSLGLIVFMIYPSVQNLRVDLTGIQSLSVQLVNYIYGLDTNTNVCPSIHVIGALGAMLIMLRTDLMKNNTKMKVLNIIVGISICLSTMFIKQHSFIDVSFGIVITLVLYNYTKSLSTKLFE